MTGLYLCFFHTKAYKIDLIEGWKVALENSTHCLSVCLEDQICRGREDSLLRATKGDSQEPSGMRKLQRIPSTRRRRRRTGRRRI